MSFNQYLPFPPLNWCESSNRTDHHTLLEATIHAFDAVSENRTFNLYIKLQNPSAKPSRTRPSFTLHEELSVDTALNAPTANLCLKQRRGLPVLALRKLGSNRMRLQHQAHSRGNLNAGLDSLTAIGAQLPGITLLSRNCTSGRATAGAR